MAEAGFWLCFLSGQVAVVAECVIVKGSASPVHAHVHALVPGGGPALTGDRRWIKSRRLNVAQCDGRYLCDSEELKKDFRKNFIAGLKRLHKNGKLKLTGEWSFLQSKAAFGVCTFFRRDTQRVVGSAVIPVVIASVTSRNAGSCSVLWQCRTCLKKQ